MAHETTIKGGCSELRVAPRALKPRLGSSEFVHPGGLRFSSA